MRVCSCVLFGRRQDPRQFLGEGLINPEFLVISEYIKLDTSSSVLKHIFDLVIHLPVILSDIKLNLP